MPRNKPESQSRAAKKTEIPPVPAEQLRQEDAEMFGEDDDGGAPTEVVEGISVPSDSTDAVPQEKDVLAELLVSRRVSVTELTPDGRGLRLYIGKPSMSTFEDMLRRSNGIGVVIEPDPRREGVSVTWLKP